MLLEFSLKPVYSTIVGKDSEIYGVHIPRKCIESGHFYLCPPSPFKTLPQCLPQKFEDDLERQVFYILCDLHFFFSSIMAYLDEGWLFIG